MRLFLLLALQTWQERLRAAPILFGPRTLGRTWGTRPHQEKAPLPYREGLVLRFFRGGFYFRVIERAGDGEAVRG